MANNNSVSSASRYAQRFFKGCVNRFGGLHMIKKYISCDSWHAVFSSDAHGYGISSCA